REQLHLGVGFEAGDVGDGDAVDEVDIAGEQGGDAGGVAGDGLDAQGGPVRLVAPVGVVPGEHLRRAGGPGGELERPGAVGGAAGVEGAGGVRALGAGHHEDVGQVGGQQWRRAVGDE